MLYALTLSELVPRRSPHGERGLKYENWYTVYMNAESLPARGAWIEISLQRKLILGIRSLPARGAWIEIPYNAAGKYYNIVAPRTGSVD